MQKFQVSGFKLQDMFWTVVSFRFLRKNPLDMLHAEMTKPET